MAILERDAAATRWTWLCSSLSPRERRPAALADLTAAEPLASDRESAVPAFATRIRASSSNATTRQSEGRPGRLARFLHLDLGRSVGAAPRGDAPA